MSVQVVSEVRDGKRREEKEKGKKEREGNKREMRVDSERKMEA